ncbi:MAG: fructosamine kinase family protein [Rhodanobacteraceae bacterium]
MSAINRLERIQLPDGRRAVVKRRDDAADGFFLAEARGLAALRGAHGLRVPEVWAVDERHIVLEDLGDGAPSGRYWRQAGAGLARQHAAAGAHFGFDHDGFCGDSPQANTPILDGWRFFAECRLLPQVHRARDHDDIGEGDVVAVERLCARLRERVPEMPPVLLHGDLWAGNLHVCGDGAPALIDAGAAHYGWAEAELAMLTLFGSPPSAFFDAYAEGAPLRVDWRVRAPLYNVYHLLNHVNLFGAGYLPALRNALSAAR